MARRIQPIPDPRRQFEPGPLNRLAERLRRRRPNRPGGPETGGVPVEPEKPRGLSGGAAAALEFDD
ncbi:MAG: hypothetical protein ACM3ZV_09000 [Bacillota bacterium]